MLGYILYYIGIYIYIYLCKFVEIVFKCVFSALYIQNIIRYECDRTT